jgi:hypothetical protein
MQKPLNETDLILMRTLIRLGVMLERYREQIEREGRASKNEEGSNVRFK